MGLNNHWPNKLGDLAAKKREESTVHDCLLRAQKLVQEAEAEIRPLHDKVDHKMWSYAFGHLVDAGQWIEFLERENRK